MKNYLLILIVYLFSICVNGQSIGVESIENALNEDGTIKKSIIGNFSAEGYSVTTNLNGAPVFKVNNFPNSTQTSTWFTLGGGVGGSVREVAVSNGNIYFGGIFTKAGGVSGFNYIAKWNGSSWSALGSGLNDEVYGIAVSGDNIYVTGKFTTAGGVSANRIAKWNGTSWSALGGGIYDSGSDGNAGWCIAVQGDDVYVGGKFLTVNNNLLLANNIAHWNGSSWQQMGSGMDSYVHKLIVHEGFVYAVGRFTTAGGNSANRIAKWDGANWSTLGSGLNNWVHDIACSGDNIFVCGSFTTAGGNSANYIAKWDGSNWSALGSGLNSIALALFLSGEDLYVGGLFTTAGGTSVNKIALWNGSWSALSPGIMEGTPTTYVDDIASNGAEIYIGGTFSRLGDGRTANYVAQIGGSNSATAIVRNPIVGGGSSTNFNTVEQITAVTISLGADAGSGEIEVYRYEDSPQNASSVTGNVSNYRWIVLPDNLSPTFTGTIRMKISEIPNAGITDPNSVKVYSRSTPGTGAFGELTTSYDAGTGELVASITSFSEFIFVSGSDILPIELSNFVANENNGEVILNWQTTTEINNYGFEIERQNSDPAYDWETLGFVEGCGNCNAPSNYEFIDKLKLQGVYQYRLKQIDINGKFKYSNVLSVNFGIPSKFSLEQNFPNPFNPSTQIQYQIAKAGHTTIKVYGILGNEITTLVQEYKQPGNYSVSWDASQMPSGIYIYRFQSGSFVDTKKMILIK